LSYVALVGCFLVLDVSCTYVVLFGLGWVGFGSVWVALLVLVIFVCSLVWCVRFLLWVVLVSELL
jgi:hypothetical protein